jgi:alkaline phosphatase D
MSRSNLPSLLESLAVIFPRAATVAAALACACPIVASGEAADDPEKVLARIAFGSCAHQDQPQPIWDTVAGAEPDLFIFLGDNIYGDTEDMGVMREKYGRLGAQPGYQKLLEKTQVIATWDDHDYGENDAGAEYPMKRESQREFLDFFGAAEDDPRRHRDGVYHSWTYGPEGRRVQVILLDGRFFRSPLVTGFEQGEPGEGIRGRYLPNEDPATTMLGETQWQWLEEQLRQPADLRIIGSAVQVVADQHGWETWGNFPHERRRLLDLIRSTDAKGVVIISGDRHFSEISKVAADAEGGVGYPLFDVTSSSLNRPSGNMTKAGTRFTNEINPHRVGLLYFDINHGLIEIDWEQEDPLLRLQVRDGAGGVVLQQRVRLGELR